MESPGRKASTFTDLLRERATSHRDRRAYAFLRDGEDVDSAVTFKELHERALVIAEHLSERYAVGDRAVLLFPPGIEFIVTFFGCLLSSVIPVPVSVPSRHRGFDIVRGIALDSGARCILSSGALISKVAGALEKEPGLAAIPCFDTDLWGLEPGSGCELPRQTPSDIALLQYTSGSTGTPRGVIVTHANLVDNHRQLEQSFRHDESTVILSWLPMFHDMGLGTVLGGLWLGVTCTLMAPTAFLQKPVRWLRAISQHRATSSGGPDFAYDLCVRRISKEEREGLDLSSWSVAYNGSEPVRASTLSRFAEAFAPYGFRRDAFYPVYGLAEATLFVSGGHARQAPVVRAFERTALEHGQAVPDSTPQGKPLIGCGAAWLGTRLLLVDPETHVPCSPAQIGEIWVGGASVAAGYWQKPVESAEVFGARTAAGEGPFLRTGDLGFQHEGQLFVTGRHKDLIIIRGRNHYPQDIETSVSEAHPALEPLACAAFSVESEDGEQLVVAHEVKRTAVHRLEPEAIFRAIRRIIADQHGVHTHAIVLLSPGNLLRTTSGKVRRKACRRAFLDNSLPALSASVFGTESLEGGAELRATDDRGAAPSPRASRPPRPSAATEAASRAADRVVEWLRDYAHGSHDPSGSDALRKLTPSLVRDLARQGVWGMQVEEQHGGLGLGHRETTRVIEQLAAIDLNAGLFVGLNNYLGVGPLLRHGTPRLQASLLPRVARGGELAAFAFAEPGSDPNPDSLKTFAEPINGSGWRLFGTKYVSGGVQGSAAISVFARHSDRQGLTAFVVPKDAPGLQRVSEAILPEAYGLTPSRIALEGIALGHDNVLGRPGEGAAIALEAMSHARLAVAAACLGGMKRCAQLVFHYSTQRQTGTGRLVAHPVTLAKLGRVTAGIAALESLVRQVARAADAGVQVPSEAFTVCKIIGPSMLWEAVDDLVQLLGRRGFVETTHIRDLVRDAQALRSCEGPSEAMSALLGARLLNGGAESVARLVSDVLGAPSAAQLVARAVQMARARLANAAEPPEHDAAYWVHLRAGELTTWVTLLSAVEGQRRATPNGDLERAFSWAQTNIERTLALLSSDAPIAIEDSDLTESVAAYSSSIGTANPLLIWAQPASADARDTAPPSSARRPAASLAAGGGSGGGKLAADDARARDQYGDGLQAWIVSWLAQRLRLAKSQVDPKRSFADHGVDSLAAVELAKALSDHLGRSLDETVLWNFATIKALVEFLDRDASMPPPPSDPAAKPAKPAEAGSQEELEDAIAQLEKELSRRS